MPAPAAPMGRFRGGLRRLFYGHRPAAVRFQIGLLALDLAAVAYFLATTFVADAPWLRAVDLALGVLLALEFLGRMLAHRHPMHYLDNAAAVIDLAVIDLAVVASLVYVTQHGTNEKIADFVDALYFTVAALSTTGFGDVTLIGSTSGELLSVAMMIVGITLFFRLAQAAFRPGGKVRHPCPRCGLLRHDPDAVHCKACGRVLNIPDDEE